VRSCVQLKGPAMSTVLIVQHNAMLRNTLARYIEDAGHNVMTGNSCKDGIALLEFATADVLTVENACRDPDGSRLITQAIEAGMPSVLFSMDVGRSGLPNTQSPPLETAVLVKHVCRKIDEAVQFSQQRCLRRPAIPT
jgi:chemotaxis response regulator CheB